MEWSIFVELAGLVLPILSGWGASGLIDWLKARGLSLEGEVGYWVSLVVSALFGALTAFLAGIVAGNITPETLSDPVRLLVYIFMAMSQADRRYNFKARSKLREDAWLQ